MEECITFGGHIKGYGCYTDVEGKDVQVKS